MPAWFEPVLNFIKWLGNLLQPLVAYLIGVQSGKAAEKVNDQKEVIKNHEKTEDYIIQELDRVSDRPRTDSDINGVFNRWKASAASGDDTKD